ncbi:C39 family peptidase [Mesobacillus harenae]|uniref:C39 family peptidase n=1 Tax=Mesobacillus harenae TaxID=2213203 RepID=UPI001F5582FF|nr:C39 family peptidase [Mesobacillus harenae]
MNKMELGYLLLLAVCLFIFFLLLLANKKLNLFLKSAIPFSVVILIAAIIFVLESSNTSHKVLSVTNWFEPSSATMAIESEVTGDLRIVKVSENVLLDVQVVSQMPELPRGCEVTSLAMLLHHAGSPVDKLSLAEQVRKDPAPYKLKAGTVIFGNPNIGFVGNMYTYTEPGLGVYHKPIFDLGEQYLPGRMQDLTGSDFQDLKIHLSDNRPVWVITNTSYKSLPEADFQTWQTPSGKVKITFKMHSVLVTGYDNEYIYFNDPLTGIKNRKAPISDFEESWVQMGRQAVTYLPR